MRLLITRSLGIGLTVHYLASSNYFLFLNLTKSSKGARFSSVNNGKKDWIDLGKLLEVSVL